MNIISLIIQIVGLAVAGALVWFVSPIVPLGDGFPFESVLWRGLLIGLLVVIWAVATALQLVAAKKKNESMLAEIGESQAEEIDEETAVIQERFKEAMTVLKTSNKGKKRQAYIYDLPWYIIIGPPGSGKTTALLNSGLSFPLEEKFGSEALKGIGGTRDCDWWFTNEAVLIDTAGRFTSQDSHKKVDEAGWEQFIQLLKRYRKERPINGAMVTMSLLDLMQQTPDERISSARTIRQRIDELNEGLGITFPVYFMFTKSDMVSGFNEFFGHYGLQERDQVWGETFGIDDGESTFDVSQYGDRYDRMVARLESQILDRIHEERDRDKRASMVGFPVQMLSLKSIICEFVQECFAPNRYSGQPLLRGIYYTSGTQEGTPIDQLLGNLAQNFGIDRDDSITYSGRGRSYFLGRLLKDVIFEEAEVAGADSAAVRMRKLFRVAGYGFAASLVAGSVGAWTLSYQANLADIQAVESALSVSEQDPRSTPTSRVAGRLDNLRQAAEQEGGTFPSLGLMQSDTVRTAASNAYQTSLETSFLPLIVSRIENRLMQAVAERDSGQVYRMLKAYLMYAGLHENAGANLEPEFLAEVNIEDWRARFADDPDLLSSLESHQQALMDSGAIQISAQDGLVKQARRLLLATPLPEQIYLSVKQTLLQNHTQDLGFSEIVGQAGVQVFVSDSGRSLVDLVMPGMYTRGGYSGLMLPLIESEAREYVENNWVLGEHNKQESRLQFAQLRDEIIASYKADYVKRWDAFINDLRIRKPGGLQDKIALLEAVATFNGPVESLFLTLSEQSSLGAVDQQARQIAGLGNAVVDPNDKVSSHFSAYTRLASAGALDRLMQEMRSVAVFVKEARVNSGADTPALDTIARRTENKDALASLRSQVPFLPDVAKRLMGGVQEIAWSVVMDQAGDELNRAWRNEVYSFYDSRLRNRYPIDAGATQEVTPDDFVAFFSDGGRLDSFVSTRLAPIVRLDAQKWEERIIDGQRVGLNASALSNLRRATQIGDYFYPSSGTGVVELSIVPVGLSSGVEKFVLTVGETQSQFTPGSGQAIKTEWPGPDKAWFQFYARERGARQATVVDGQWSLFRLIQSATMERSSRNVWRVGFEQEGFAATYDVRVEGDGEVLSASLLAGLNVPKEL